MDKRIALLLVACLIHEFKCVAERDNDSPQRLSYLDVLKVFTEIAEQYRNWKTARHVETHRQIDNIISQIQSIIPGLETLHNLAHNISKTVPLVTTNIHEPLHKVQTNLKEVLGRLHKCHNTPNVPVSGESTSSSEEIQEHHQSLTESVEQDQRLHRVTYDTRGSHILDVVTPVTIDNSRLNAILASYNTNSVASLNDTAKAFKAVADKFSEEHKLRSLNLAPKILEVKDKINTVTQHVTHITAELADVNTNAAMFYNSSISCVDELTKLTAAVRDFADQIC